MFTLRPVPSVGGARRSRGFVVLVAFVVLFVLAPPFAPSARAFSGWFVVDVTNSTITGEGWTPSTTVEITIDVAGTPVGPDVMYYANVTPASTFDYSWSGYAPEAGDVVAVSDDNGVTKIHQVEPLVVMGSDEAADTVFGTGNPWATVAVWIEGVPLTTLVGHADASGYWSFDYTGTADLKAGMTVMFRAYDDEWDATQIEATLPISDDFDGDTILNMDDNCPWTPNRAQYDGDGDGKGMWCDDVDRVWGANRYATAAAVSLMAFDPLATVFIALGTDYPDALVAAAAGGSMHAPVLLTTTDSLPAETVAELKRLKPHTAYIVGGTAVIRSSVEQQVGALVPTVKRLAGADRYETAAAVAKEIYPKATVAFVALGTNFPDALVAASPAGMVGAPVLLTAHDHVPQATLDVLADLHPTRIFVVGGTAAISETAAQELSVYGPVERLAGANRYETAAVVGDWFFGQDRLVLLAYGRNFPDALVAGVVGGLLGGPVLLVDRTSIPPATRSALDRLTPHFNWIVGGTAVISEDVFNALP